MAQKISQYFDYKLAGKEYKLRFKTPTVGQQISIGQTFASLKAGFNKLDELSENLAYAIATLNVVIMDKPEDLKLDALGIDDWSTLTKMLEEYRAFAFFREPEPESTTSP